MILLQGSDVGCTPATHPRHVIEAASLKFQAGLHLCRQSITGSQDKLFLGWRAEIDSSKDADENENEHQHESCIQHET